MKGLGSLARFSMEHDIQKLLVYQGANIAIVNIIDWKNRQSWFEVNTYPSVSRCETFAEALEEFEKKKREIEGENGNGGK